MGNDGFSFALGGIESRICRAWFGLPAVDGRGSRGRVGLVVFAVSAAAGVAVAATKPLGGKPKRGG